MILDDAVDPTKINTVMQCMTMIRTLAFLFRSIWRVARRDLNYMYMVHSSYRGPHTS